MLEVLRGHDGAGFWEWWKTANGVQLLLWKGTATAGEMLAARGSSSLVTLLDRGQEEAAGQVV